MSSHSLSNKQQKRATCEGDLCFKHESIQSIVSVLKKKDKFQVHYEEKDSRIMYLISFDFTWNIQFGSGPPLGERHQLGWEKMVAHRKTNTTAWGKALRRAMQVPQ